MNIEKAVSAVVRHILKTGQDDTSSVKKLWSQLCLSQPDVVTLAQEALVSQVGDLRRNPPRRTKDIVVNRVEVRMEPKQDAKLIRVQILHTTAYNINGINRVLIQFTKSDCQAYIESQQACLVGIQRHIDAADYTKQKLSSYKKNSVADLPYDVQVDVAEMWESLRTVREEEAVAA